MWCRAVNPEVPFAAEALRACAASADAGPVMPAVRATAAAVAMLATHVLFTCLRKSPPGDVVRTRNSFIRPGEVPYTCACTPRTTQYARGVIGRQYSGEGKELTGLFRYAPALPLLYAFMPSRFRCPFRPPRSP
ncbi:hypothetical protein GCM10023335_66100 [Streptomyces siamensis]|uniref:Uncharacterized protein n=1 Tax=Streptomyces siamensis TaxID=1274986 RepID=A0ABP9JD31_9ACTN